MKRSFASTLAKLDLGMDRRELITGGAALAAMAALPADGATLPQKLAASFKQRASAALYNMPGVYFNKTEAKKATAQAGVSDGPNATFCIWYKMAFYNDPTSRAQKLYTSLNANMFGNPDGPAVDSEHSKGFNVLGDNAGGAIGSSLRINCGNSARTVFYNPTALYSTHAIPFVNSQYAAIIGSVNTRFSSANGWTRAGAAYLIVPGQAYVQLIDSLDMGTQFDINHTFSSAGSSGSFSLGGKFNGQTGYDDQRGAVYGDFWYDTGHSIVVEAVANHASIATADLQKLVTSTGYPRDLGSDGSGAFGYQPTRYHKGDASTWLTNLGYGGDLVLTPNSSFTVHSGGGLVNAPYPVLGVPAGKVALNWIEQCSPPNPVSAAAQTLVFDTGQNNSAVGDLITLTISASYSGQDASAAVPTPPSGWVIPTGGSVVTSTTLDGSSCQIVAVMTRTLTSGDLDANNQIIWSNWTFTLGALTGGAKYYCITTEISNWGAALVDDCKAKSNTTASTNVPSTNCTATTSTGLEVYTGTDWYGAEGPYGAPSGFTELTNIQTATYPTAVWTSVKQLSTSGTITGPTGTKGTANPSSSVHMVLKHS